MMWDMTWQQIEHIISNRETDLPVTVEADDDLI